MPDHRDLSTYQPADKARSSEILRKALDEAQGDTDDLLWDLDRDLDSPDFPDQLVEVSLPAWALAWFGRYALKRLEYEYFRVRLHEHYLAEGYYATRNAAKIRESTVTRRHLPRVGPLTDVVKRIGEALRSPPIIDPRYEGGHADGP